VILEVYPAEDYINCHDTAEDNENVVIFPLDITEYSPEDKTQNK
jgi:hypothetical protein